LLLIVFCVFCLFCLFCLSSSVVLSSTVLFFRSSLEGTWLAWCHIGLCLTQCGQGGMSIFKTNLTLLRLFVVDRSTTGAGSPPYDFQSKKKSSFALSARSQTACF